jgi:putative glutamine amidotransferase
MRPSILLTTSSNFSDQGLRRTSSTTGRNYSQAILQAGGLPFMLANAAPELAESYLEHADGLLFTGGADIDPSHFGQEAQPDLGEVDAERDAFELALYQVAKARKLPILGVCRGIQLVNVAEGGMLHQHLGALSGLIQHRQRSNGPSLAHQVKLESTSRLAKAFGQNVIRSNSFHHQAIDRLGQDLRVAAKTSDGIIEAVEGAGGHFVLAVQWHPEMIFQAFPEHHKIFQAFVAAAKQSRQPETLLV